MKPKRPLCISWIKLSQSWRNNLWMIWKSNLNIWKNGYFLLKWTSVGKKVTEHQHTHFKTKPISSVIRNLTCLPKNEALTIINTFPNMAIQSNLQAQQQQSPQTKVKLKSLLYTDNRKKIIPVYAKANLEIVQSPV